VSPPSPAARIPWFARHRRARSTGNVHEPIRLSSHAAQAEVDRVRLVLRDLLADSFRRYQINRIQVDRFRKIILPNAEQIMKMANGGYESGETGIVEVLNARQTYFHARLAYVEAATELRKALIEIDGLELTGGLNPSAVGTALQAQPGGGPTRQRALLNQVQDAASRQLMPAAQLGR
jgi:hypothetical protein